MHGCISPSAGIGRSRREPGDMSRDATRQANCIFNCSLVKSFIHFYHLQNKKAVLSQGNRAMRRCRYKFRPMRKHNCAVCFATSKPWPLHLLLTSLQLCWHLVEKYTVYKENSSVCSWTSYIRRWMNFSTCPTRRNHAIRTRKTTMVGSQWNRKGNQDSSVNPSPSTKLNRNSSGGARTPIQPWHFATFPGQ